MNLKFTQLPKSGLVPVQGAWLLVQGGEAHLKRMLVERLRGQLLQAGDEFNFDLVDVNERWDGVADTAEQAKRERMPTRADRILSLAQALPFLGSGRLVIVRNVDLLSNEQQKKLAVGIASVPPMNHLLLVTGETEAGKKPATLAVDLSRGIDNSGTIYDCSSLTDGEAEEWVRETLKSWKQTIDGDALRLLISRTGTELRRLQIEVDKLSLMVGDGGRIRGRDVELMTPKQAEESVFHLADAVAARNGAQALAVLRELMEVQMETPFRIFPLIVRQFRLIWITKILLEAGWRPKMDPREFPKALELLTEEAPISQLAGWMGSKLAGAARLMSWEQLTAAYQAILECDMASKAIEGVPRQDPELALEMLCAKLSAPVGNTRRGGSAWQ